MSTGFVSLVGNKTMPLHRRPELKSVQRFAIDRRDGPPRLPFLPRPALGKLPAGYLFEIGFNFEHCYLRFRWPQKYRRELIVFIPIITLGKTQTYVLIRKLDMTSAQASGVSICGRWPAFGIILNSDPPIPSWYACPCAVDTKPSRSPQMIKVDASTRYRYRSNFGLSGNCQAKRAKVCRAKRTLTISSGFGVSGMTSSAKVEDGSAKITWRLAAGSRLRMSAAGASGTRNPSASMRTKPLK